MRVPASTKIASALVSGSSLVRKVPSCRKEYRAKATAASTRTTSRRRRRPPARIRFGGTGTFARPPRGPGAEKRASALDQTYVAGPRALGGLFGRKLHALAFAKQLENCAPDCAAVEEVLDAALISDEPKSFVDEEACDSAVGHSRIPPMRAKPETISGAHGPLTSGI